jgi:predicted GNAT family acetyltransferase
MLVYNDSMVQLRGSPEAVGFLLSSLNMENIDVQAPADCLDMLLAKFPVYKTKENLTLMRLEKGKENPKIVEEPERLHTENADEIAELMRESYPLMWSEMTGEKVKVLTSAKEAVQFGIRREGRLVALGAGFLTPHMSVVTWLATLKGFRRQGFCVSLLSVLVHEGLKTADFVAIYVLDENSAARRIYETVGFRAYRSFVLLRI